MLSELRAYLFDVQQVCNLNMAIDTMTSDNKSNKPAKIFNTDVYHNAQKSIMHKNLK